jgi:hypothetical protein
MNQMFSVSIQQWKHYRYSAFPSLAGATLDAELLARSQYSKVLRPATSTQVFIGFPVSISKC